jgi:hypothetical protein
LALELDHGSLKNLKPKEFETYVETLAYQHKPIAQINHLTEIGQPYSGKLNPGTLNLELKPLARFGK